MKRILLLIALSYTIFCVYNQSLEIYYDDNLKITLKEFSSFKRIWYSDQIYNSKFTDIDNEGFKIREGNYLDSIKEGEFVFYFLKSNRVYSKGIYSNDKMAGTWHFYYENGQLKYIIEFSNEDFHVTSSFDSLGNKNIINGTGQFEYKFNDENNNLACIKGSFIDNNKNGEWILTVDDKLILKEIYDLGNFKKGYTYNAFSQPSKVKEPVITYRLFESTNLLFIEENHYSNFLYKENYPFLNSLPQRPNSSVFSSIKGQAVGLLENQMVTDIEQPKYPGGEEEFQKLYNIPVLREAVYSYINEGRYYVNFEIDTLGIPRNINIVKAPNAAFKEVTIDAIKNCKRWLPATYQGKPVRAKMTYMIQFRLTN